MINESTKYDFNYLKSLIIYVFMTLAVMTLATFTAKGQIFIYFIIVFLWIVFLFSYDLIKYKKMLLHQWITIKNNKLIFTAWIIFFFLLVHIAVMTASYFLKPFIDETPHFYTYSNSSDTLPNLFLALIFSFIPLLVAFIEEIAFRYELFYRFKNNIYLFVFSALTSSILFGLTHFYNFNGSIIGTLIYACSGIVFCISYVVTKNIWVPIIVHVLFNSIEILSSLILILFKLIQG